jgi:hypothetical protein
MAMNSSQEEEKLSPEYKFSIITVYGPMIYGPICNAIDVGKSITRVSRRGLALEIENFLDPVK